ncbi:hypothetical protein EV424DRAFT_1345113 [Suillus variegatus]|nr:hypothetical protein EV424DRAFT_1345113 [Suillus variegatus]
MHTYMSGGRCSTPAGIHLPQPTRGAVHQQPTAIKPCTGILYGGMVSFRLRGGARSAKALFPRFTLAESLSGVESLAELPARMTHASIPAAEHEALGIEGLILL